ncbi:hypothetical protein [Nonomuraea wenchangensis]|uniref:hypothetical protein n=1 Tax=Nonomuraea wenchangensis TaxID=568860 RepID=UPI0033EB8DA2
MLQPGRLAFTGDVGTTEPHAHAALQVLIVTAGTVELADAHHTRRRVRAAIIPPRARHAVRGGPGARADMLYLDPAGGAGRHLLTALTWPGRDRVSDWVTAAHALLPERTGAGAGDGPRDPAALVRAWTAPSTCRPAAWATCSPPSSPCPTPSTCAGSACAAPSSWPATAPR